MKLKEAGPRKPWVRRVQLLVATVLVSFFCLLLFRAFQSEPNYQGKTLTGWVLEMNRNAGSAKGDEASHIVRQLASNSIPLLIGWMGKRDSHFKEKVNHMLDKQRVIRFRFDVGLLNPREIAYFALIQLRGPGAEPAIPGLIHLLEDKRDDVAGSACMTLIQLGPESIPPLIESLTNKNDRAWMMAAGALGMLREDEGHESARAAIPYLEKRLRDTNAMVRAVSAENISKLGGHHEPCVTALLKSFEEGDVDTRDFVLSALRRFKEHSQLIVPLLTKSLAVETNVALRLEIGNTVKDLNLEAAKGIP